MKNITVTLLFLAITLTAFGHSESDSSANLAIQSGVGLGSVIAVVTSWHRNKSVLWAILHGILSWIYVIYFVFTDK